MRKLKCGCAPAMHAWSTEFRRGQGGVTVAFLYDGDYDGPYDQDMIRWTVGTVDIMSINRITRWPGMQPWKPSKIARALAERLPTMRCAVSLWREGRLVDQVVHDPFKASGIHTRAA